MEPLRRPVVAPPPVGGLAPDGSITIRLHDIQTVPSTSAMLGNLGASAGPSNEPADDDEGTVGTLGRYQAVRAGRGGGGRGRGALRGGRTGGRAGRGPAAKKRPRPAAAAGEGGAEDEQVDKRKQQRALERAHNENALSGGGDASAARRLQVGGWDLLCRSAYVLPVSLSVGCSCSTACLNSFLGLHLPCGLLHPIGCWQHLLRRDVLLCDYMSRTLVLGLLCQPARAFSQA